MQFFHHGHGHEQRMKLMDKLLQLFQLQVDIRYQQVLRLIKHVLFLEQSHKYTYLIKKITNLMRVF